MRRTQILLRGAKGRGWYLKYKEKGPEAFRKNDPPSPFNWEEMCPIGELVLGAPITKRPVAYFDIAIDGKKEGRVEFELASDVVPRTVDNFIRLCTNGEHQIMDDPAPSDIVTRARSGTSAIHSKGVKGYKGTMIHQIQKNHIIMGGDIEGMGGKSSHSAYEERFIDEENFIIPNSGKGLLSFASVGVARTGSQFIISTSEKGLPHMNGRCVVFGRVLKGLELLDEIDEIYCFRGAPQKNVTIAECGMVEES